MSHLDYSSNNELILPILSLSSSTLPEVSSSEPITIGTQTETHGRFGI